MSDLMLMNLLLLIEMCIRDSVIGVRHLHGVFIAVQIALRICIVAGSGFRAVSRFRGDGFR